MDWTNFNSGITGSLIGALVGFFAAIYCQRSGLRQSIKTQIREKLIKLKSYEFATVAAGNEPKIDYGDAYIRSFSELMSLYLSYRDLVWCSCRLDNAWREYKGVSKKTENYLSETCSKPTSKEELEKRASDFLKNL